ncbi:MAG: hypothetical protein WAU88_04800 [Candidatus Zixiibacteriota bacterium]|jgi:hypothetical protein
MNIFDKMMALDRRWIFLLLAIVCVIAYSLSFEVPVVPTDEVKSVYNHIEALKPGQIVFIAIDYDPSSQAELHPMAYAMMEQCFRKNLRVIITALSQNGPGMADQAIREISDSLKYERKYNGVTYPPRDIKRGEDYVFLGYKPYPTLIILGMGQNFRIPFPNDYYGTPLDQIPMMKGVINYDQVACVVSLASGNIADMWIADGQGRYNFKMAFGLTGVMGADYYPYLASGQIFGLMAGLYGAAQYEKLADNAGMAKDGMRIQLLAHWLIIAFIVIGNIGFFVTRRQRRMQEKGGTRS